MSRKTRKQSVMWPNNLDALDVGGYVETQPLYDRATEKPKNTQHPLKNPASRYYEVVPGIESIDIMEKLFTVEELKAWAKITSMKYQLRMGKKDDVQKEKAKKKTYDDYYDYLKGFES